MAEGVLDRLRTIQSQPVPPKESQSSRFPLYSYSTFKNNTTHSTPPPPNTTTTTTTTRTIDIEKAPLKRRALISVDFRHQDPAPNNATTFGTILQRHQCEEEECGTLTKFLIDPEKERREEEKNKKNIKKTHYLKNLRKKTQEATRAATKAAGLRTRDETQRTSVAVATLGARMVKMTRKKIQHRDYNMYR